MARAAAPGVRAAGVAPGPARLPSASPRPRSALGSSRLSGRAPGRMGLPCHRPPGAAATQRDTATPRSHRYVGELISDSEADVREEDSYLFDLDNKVRCPRGRASAQSQPPFCGVLSWEPDLRPLSLCGACVTQAPRGPEARGPRAEWRPARPVRQPGRRGVPQTVAPPPPGPGSQGCPRVHRTPVSELPGTPVRARGSKGALLCGRSRRPSAVTLRPGRAPPPSPAEGSVCGTRAFRPGQLARPCPGSPRVPARCPLGPRSVRAGDFPRGQSPRVSAERRPRARAAPSSRGGVRAQRRSRRSWPGVRRPSAPLGVCDVLRAVSDTRRLLGRGHTPPPRSRALLVPRRPGCLSPARGRAAVAPAPTVPSAGPSRGPCASPSLAVSRRES